jgi:protein SCO1
VSGRGVALATVSRRLRIASIALGLAIVTALSGLVISACGGGSDSGSAGTDTTTTTAAQGIIFPPAPAPALGLKDSLGQEITTAQFQGKPLLVTFVYSHCPDVCPLIVSNFRRILKKPAAKDLQIVAVSVDPEGDTKAAVTKYLQTMGMTGKMHWIIGTRAELEPVWARWGITAAAAPDDPEIVEHAAPIYGVDAGGSIQSLYDPSFKPADVIADLPRLSRAS